MALKIVEQNLDAVEPAFHSLYTETDGVFKLTGIEGLKTEADITRLTTALNKERTEHKSTKEKFSLLADKDPVEILAALDRIPELELAAKGKLDEAKIDEIVANRLQSKLVPLERQLQQVTVEKTNLEKINQEFTVKEKTRTIHSEVAKAAKALNMIPDAVDDAVMLAERLFEIDESGSVVTRDNVGVTPGLDAKMWLSDLQAKKPHWWGPTSGGGAQGSVGGQGFKNPFTAEYWNLTEQGKLYSSNPAKAAQYAEAAGTSIGGGKPPAKK